MESFHDKETIVSLNVLFHHLMKFSPVTAQHRRVLL